MPYHCTPVCNSYPVGYESHKPTTSHFRRFMLRAILPSFLDESPAAVPQGERAGIW